MRSPIIAAAAIAAIALTGCSSDKKNDAANTTSPAPSPTPSLLAKADFVTQANALCDKYLTQVKALPQPTGPADYANIATALKTTLELAPQYNAEIAALV